MGHQEGDVRWECVVGHQERDVRWECVVGHQEGDVRWEYFTKFLRLRLLISNTSTRCNQPLQ